MGGGDSTMAALVAGTATALDSALLSASPVAVVPGHSPFVPLDSPGRRILLARDGVYLEARSAVLWCRFRLASCALPFGPLTALNGSTTALALIGGPLGRSVFDRLATLAEMAHPNEMAALVVREDDGSDRIHVPAQTGRLGAVSYNDADTTESRLLLDVHSHGPFPASFSATDNASDRSRIGPHISLLFGHCESGATLRFAARLCVGSHLIALDHRMLAALIEDDADCTSAVSR